MNGGYNATIDNRSFTPNIRLVGLIEDSSNKEEIGYLLLNEQTMLFYTIPQSFIGGYASISQKLKNFSINIVGKDADGHYLSKVSCTDCSLKRLPVYDIKTMKCIRNPGIVILGTVGGEKRFLVVNTSVNVVITTESELINSGAALVNAKIVARGNTKYISAIKGTFETIRKNKRIEERVGQK